jgi:hypothetical protein
MRTLRTFIVLLCLVLLGAFAQISFAQISSAVAAVTQKGTYHPVSPARLLNTRDAPGTPLGAGQTLQLAVSGRAGVPASGVAAVVLNITVTGATVGSYLAAYPSGQARPTASSINFVPGVNRANIATVPIGAGGQIAIYNNAGTVSVIVDVMGFYAAGDTTLTNGDEFTPVPPDRLKDTRQDSLGPVAGKEILTMDVDFGAGGASSASVRALALNLTAVGAQGSGFLSAYDGASTLPNTSSLNFQDPGATANMVVVKTAFCTDCASPPSVEFGVYNGSNDPVHVIVDLVGVYYNDGSIGDRFTPIAPVRISDSRTGLNGNPLTAKQTQLLTAPAGVVSPDTVALVSNATAVKPTASTYLTLWEGGTSKPPASNLNAPVNTTVANGAVIGLSTANKFDIYNDAGTTDFLIDVTGRFDIGAGAAVATTKSRGSAHTFTTVVASSQRRSGPNHR